MVAALNVPASLRAGVKVPNAAQPSRPARSTAISWLERATDDAGQVSLAAVREVMRDRRGEAEGLLAAAEAEGLLVRRGPGRWSRV